MNNNNAYYHINWKKLLEQAKQSYHHQGSTKQSKEHYKNNKERLQEQARNKCRELFNEQKDMKRIWEK